MKSVPGDARVASCQRNTGLLVCFGIVISILILDVVTSRLSGQCTATVKLLARMPTSSGVGSPVGVAPNMTSTPAAAAARVAGAVRAWLQKPPSAATAQQQALPLPPEWRRHHIFNGSDGELDPCPGDDEWPPGLWMRPVSLNASVPGGPAGANPPASDGRVLPLTLQAQWAIYKHQHPADCKSAKYLVYEAVQSGIGSVLHVETLALRAALDSGRILVEAPGHFLTSHPWCGANTTPDSCYFLPLSNCTLTDSELAGAERSHDLGNRLKARDLSLPRVVRGNYDSLVWAFRAPAPAMFEAALNKTVMPHPENDVTWWRAQGVAYLLRPNERAAQELRLRLRDKLRVEAPPPGCVSLYIRHGDKHVESKVYEDPEYEEAVKKLLGVDRSLSRHVFLSTEDPATVTYFTNASRKWLTSWVDMPRKPDRNTPNLVYMAQHGYAEEMLDSLLNLDLALQCDGFVGTFASNWGRLIDEMRSTVRCKAHKVFWDVGRDSPVGVPGSWRHKSCS